MINSKQRAVLRKMANTIEPVIHIGKGGITENLIQQTEQTLYSKELVKFSILRNVTDPVREICENIAKQTEADIVQIIGRKFVLYKKNPDEPVLMI